MRVKAPVVSEDVNDPARMTGVDNTTTGVDAKDSGTPGVKDENIRVEDKNISIKDDGNHDDAVGIDARYGTCNHNHDLQPCRPSCNYSHFHADLEHTMMTQYNVKKGLKMFGQASAEAVIEEMKQLHDWAVTYHASPAC